MKIKQIYLNYRIPPNLQDHMLRAASVGAYISDHWKNKADLDKNSMIQALLLHDMGNIIKFDFRFSYLLGKEEANTGYWKKIQQEFIKKYGDDEHVATVEIAKEIGLRDRAF